MKRARPLSPHLQIYKPQMTSVLSILHRAMGVVLSFGMVGVVFWLFLLSKHGSVCGAEPGENPTGCYGAFQGFLGSVFGTLLLMGFSFAFFYHLCNGIRHLFWDAGCGYKIEVAEKTGLLVVVASFGLTAFFWACVLL